MKYTINPSNDKYQVIAILYEGLAAEFIEMLMQNNKLSQYLYYENKELLSTFAYMFIKNEHNDNKITITGTIYIKEIDAKIIE